LGPAPKRGTMTNWLTPARGEGVDLDCGRPEQRGRRIAPVDPDAEMVKYVYTSP